VLDLAKNNIGNDGLQNLASYLKQNNSLVSLDLGSNDITNSGAAMLFDVIK